MKRNIITITILCAGFLILSGSAAPNEIIDPITGLSRPMTTSEKIKSKRLNIPLTVVNKDVATAVAEYVNRPWRHTDNEARVVRADKDDLGYTHVRMKQYYKGIPVEGVQIIVHVNGANRIYLITGEFNNRVNVDVKPKITLASAENIATNDALTHKCLDKECYNWVDIDSVWPPISLDVIGRSEQAIQIIGEPSLLIYSELSLAYRIIVRERVKDFADWEYWVDAHSGNVILKRNGMDYHSEPPTNQGYDTLISGVRLAHEVIPGTDSTTSITCWRDTGAASPNKRYFLYYKGNAPLRIAPWGVFNLDTNDAISDTSIDDSCRWTQRNTSNWSNTNKMAISAANNLDLVQKYMADSVWSYGFDGNGKFTRLCIADSANNVRNNAMFLHTDSTLYFGIVTNPTFSDFGVLDIVAHEYGHAFNYCTSNLSSQLTGREQHSINEAFADLFAMAVEFASQPDSSSRYPNSVPGCADWYHGEDNLNNTWQATRDFQYIFRTQHLDSINTGKATYYYDSLYQFTMNFRDRGGVLNSAFYLLSKGNPDSIRHNRGNAFGTFTGVGVAKAARIALRANAYFLTSHCVYQDVKRAWLFAAQDLVDSGIVPSFAIASIESIWTSAIGVKEEFRLLQDDWPRLQLDQGSVSMKCQNLTKNLGAIGDTCYRFSYKSTGKGMGFSTNNLANQNLYYTGTWTSQTHETIDTGSHQGGLVFRDSKDSIRVFIDSLGNVKMRNGIWGNLY